MKKTHDTEKTKHRPHQHLISTDATKTTCRRCGQLILNGYDEGLLARVDYTPIATVGADLAPEVAAIMDGRTTYVVTSTHDIVQRDADRIASGQPRGTIHRSHRCTVIVQPDLWAA